MITSPCLVILTMRLRTIFLRIDLDGMKSLIKIPTYYKNPTNLTYTVLMLRNSNQNFLKFWYDRNWIIGFSKDDSHLFQNLLPEKGSESY